MPLHEPAERTSRAGHQTRLRQEFGRQPLRSSRSATPASDARVAPAAERPRG